MATGTATWKVGTITVPAATGSVATTGLGDTPAAVFFFGTNWLTEDSAVTSNGSGLFRGMCAPKWDSPGTLVQQAACVVCAPAGNAHSIQNTAVRMLNTGGGTTLLYAASVTSLDADGFTLNWTTAAAGGYKIVYAALMTVEDYGGYIGAGTTLGLGWKAGASLLHGAWAAPIDGTDRTQEFYGGGAYPSAGSGNWQGAGLTAFTFPTSPSAQYNIGIYNLNPGTAVCEGGSFIGPFLSTQNVTAYPSGVGNTNFTFSFNDASNAGMVVVWDDEDNRTGRITPASGQGGTATVSGLPFAPGFLTGYTISNEPQGQGTGGRGAVGLLAVTTDFQWCATVDGKTDQGAFQSFQRGFADVVNGTSVHAGTVTLTGDGFVMTTEEDDVSPVNVVWHVFGHPQPGAWIPQIYRLVMPT